MHAASVDRVPAAALGVLAEAIEIGLAVVLVDEIVLAWHVMNIELGFADGFFGIVELHGLRKMGDIAGVDHEGGPDWKVAHLADRFLQSSQRVGVGRFVEADMAVGNLQEAETRGLLSGRLRRTRAEELRGFRHATAERPNDAGPSPDHTFEGAAPVDPCVLLVVRHVFFSIHRATAVLLRCYRLDLPARLFIPGSLKNSWR